MFTEGLDESAINWIKQGSDVDKSETRSPLSEKLEQSYQIPRSPLGLSSSAYSSSHVLPPLKFHSGLLGAHSTVSVSLESDEADSDNNYNNDSESISSVSDEFNRNCYDDEEEFVEKPVLPGYGEEMLSARTRVNLNPSEEIGLGSKFVSTLNRGVLKENLRIEVPENIRRYTDGETEFGICRQRSVASMVGSCRLTGKAQPHSAYATPIGNLSDLGTPSAPPIMEFGKEVQDADTGSYVGTDTEDLNRIEQTACQVNMINESEAVHYSSIGAVSDKKERCDREDDIMAETREAESLLRTDSMVYSPCYDASGQNAWQTLIAYDACIRLCLNSWARGCTEAPEFLRDECLLLRSAFGLHKLLLQPRGLQQKERTSATAEQALPLKMNKVVGKIRVEVRKLRVIPRRKLRNINSLRGAMYIQAGAEYVRHVSSVVKHGINSLKLSQFSLPSEESLSCLLHLRSATEDNEIESGSAISLRPGSGDYYDFFPENQGDTLLLEVQDSRKNLQGRATIPVSSMNDNPNDKSRWWPIYLDDCECVGKVQLSISSAFTCDETSNVKSGPIVETLAYDLLLEASMRAEKFRARNLLLGGPWKWLLKEFADYYGVSDSYTRLRYLSYIMNVATPTKDCLELVHDLLVPVMKARSEKSLTRQEKSILLDCETQVERLLAEVFENYKSLDESSPSGLADMSGQIPETAAPALAHAVQVFTLLHDILAQDAQTVLKKYIQTAATKRCRKYMLETDEFVSCNSEGFIMDSVSISTAYLKMKNLCINISNEIQADMKIHNEHILPSSIDLSSITAEVYSSELWKRLKDFLAVWPPSGPLPHVNELLVATDDFERNLGSWNISLAHDGFDSRHLFHNYIMVWVQDMQLSLLELCKAEKVPWSGVVTNYSTSPFAEEMFSKIKEMTMEYNVVIHRWPQYTMILENAAADVERAIIKALEKQYSDILTPLKDSIPKKLGMQVQKFARRQSATVYSIPPQLGTFMNTIQRVLDVLHCRIEDTLKSWASFLPVNGDKKSSFGEQMNGVTVLLRTKYKNYMQAIVVKLASNMQANRGTRLQRILEETKEADGEGEIRERMQMLSAQLSDSITNLHEVFSTQIFIAICRGFWDRMGQIILKFLEGRKENRVWYSGSYHALGVLDDIFASQMQRLQGNALKDKDLEPPRSIKEARSILCKDATNGTGTSTYLYF